MFISCAMTLAAFNISKAIVNGQEITPEVQYTTGTIRYVGSAIALTCGYVIIDCPLYSHPQPFRCSIKPRSAQAEALILGHDTT